MDKSRIVRWLYWSSLILIIVLILLVFIHLTPLLTPIYAVASALVLPLGIAIVIAYLLHPIVEKLHEVGLSRTIATLILFLSLIGLLVLIGMLGFPELKNNLNFLLKLYQSRFI